MSASFSCACDAPTVTPPQNPPGLPNIAYRDTDFAVIRAALLVPLSTETQLSAWRPSASGDLALMMAEWFAYLGDIITFYNERIANEDYLGTATQARSVINLIRLLGYRPQPGVGASATLAALLQTGPSYGQTVTLPQGLQVTSKPSPGQPPQTFELGQQTALIAPDSVTAKAPLSLLSPSASTILLAGAVSSIMGGDYLILRPRGGGTSNLVGVTSSVINAPASGSKQTALTVSFPNNDVPTGSPAASLRLDKPTLTASLWTLTSNYIDGNGVHLSGLARSIKAGDPLLFLIAGGSPLLTAVGSLTDVIWDSTGAPPSAPSTTSTTATTSTSSSGTTLTSTSTASSTPITLIPHTAITLASGAIPAGTPASAVTLLYNFVEAATLVDQPVNIWPGPNAASPPALVTASAFPAANSAQVLIADATGAGIGAQAASSAGSQTMTVAGMGANPPSLQTPLTVLYNLLPFTCGKTVASEVLGSGDPTQANQTFQLAKSPLTYLRPAATLISTLSISVNGQAWTEVANLFNQASSATVFVTSQDENQITTVMFGDGVNGARLPAGIGNVVATYRYGSGLPSPPAGALTVIATPYPGLRAVLNPVAASGGVDPDPADQIQTYAPRSVLTFGRAVSTPDYEAIAAQIAGGARVSALWTFDPGNQCGRVTVYVAADAATIANVQRGLAAAGDPNRPARALAATAIPVFIGIELLITSSADAPTVVAGVQTALSDPSAGLFGAQNLGIGQSVFNSQIAAACQTISGFVAIEVLLFYRADTNVFDAGPLHRAGEGRYFDVDPDSIWCVTRVAGNG